MTLDEIAIKHGTDKATVHSVKGHGYTPYYEFYFNRRNYPVKLLEIGVGGGESIKTWLDYFPNGQIRGLDIVQKTNEWNDPESSPDPRYQFLQGDQTDKVMWACALANWGKDFDIVIDDGSHMANAVITSFECLWPAVKPGGWGLYCIEDLAVADDPGTVFVPAGWPNHLDWIRSKMVEINGGGEIEGLHYVQELAIFRKR